jgi:protein-S-isoprenylcysteine O-methyltransferase Ste14
MAAMRTLALAASRLQSRTLGILFGLGTQAFFAFTVWHLFWFLRDGTAAQSHASLSADALLALQFAVAHSLLLLPASRAFISKHLPGEMFGSLFTVATCLGLLSMVCCWQGSPIVVWQATGWAETAVRAGFYGSWFSLFYTLSLTGFGYQTGWTQWLYWVRDERLPRRPFVPRSLYRWLRHPVYLSFAGLVWFAPRMTLDHAILTGLWTAYILVGSCLKDQRLAFYLGDTYRDYCARVPGYPLMFFGPLAKWPKQSIDVAATDATPIERPLVREAA